MACNFEHERRRQGSLSPGRVINSEKILLAIVEPFNWEHGCFTNDAFPKKRLENCEQSVSRQRYATPNSLQKFVVNPLLRKSGRVLKGFSCVPCSSLRAENGSSGYREFVIVDNAYEDNDSGIHFAHAHIGFSPDVLKSPQTKNAKVAAVENLRDILQNGFKHSGDAYNARECFLPFPLFLFTPYILKIRMWSVIIAIFRKFKCLL
jgi:hypothetical protein